ncbi:MAG: hypothetical protein KBC76_01635 [Deltaproteobacteria bacterium]|nr:hypothetical protein [Deltaproteobacteria bacterium]NMD39582.1 S46 family peptidase [Deltaproteobacteria bacterium]HON95629.1 hypothetical protein [Deltaproteobacteria bacterium]
MDKQLLEFWGTMMLSAAEGQRHLEEIVKWMTGNIKDYSDLSDVFRRLYRIEPGREQESDYLAPWQKAMNEFRESYGELVAMMDLVPRRDYIAVSRENQELNRRVSELEDAVRHLRTLLDERMTAPAEGLKGFQELIDDQARKYQEFMDTMTTVFDERRSKAAGAQPGKPLKGRQKTKPAGKRGAESGRK